MKKNAKIYVAGHLGLVGSALMRNLSAQGYNHFVTRSFNELNLIDQSAVIDFFEKEKPEYVFLAAAKVGGIHANSTYPAQFIYENLMIQNNIIHNAYVHGVKKLLFLGSSCIYPKLCPQPMKEDYLLSGQLESTNEAYAIAKIAGLKMCYYYNQQYGTKFMSVMPTNLYGPGDNYNLENSHVLPALIRKIHLGKLLESNDFNGIIDNFLMYPMQLIQPKLMSQSEWLKFLDKLGIRKISTNIIVEIWGTGTPFRELMHSDDMAQACIYLMNHYHGNDFFNIGTGEEISIKALAELVKKIIGFKGELIFNINKPDGTQRKLQDVSKIHSIGWHHTISLKDGIQRVYERFSQSPTLFSEDNLRQGLVPNH